MGSVLIGAVMPKAAVVGVFAWSGTWHAVMCLFVKMSTACGMFFVLETVRTSAMRVIHITVKTEETQRLRIKFVLYCST